MLVKKKQQLHIKGSLWGYCLTVKNTKGKMLEANPNLGACQFTEAYKGCLFEILNL